MGSCLVKDRSKEASVARDECVGGNDQDIKKANTQVVAPNRARVESVEDDLVGKQVLPLPALPPRSTTPRLSSGDAARPSKGVSTQRDGQGSRDAPGSNTSESDTVHGYHKRPINFSFEELGEATEEFKNANYLGEGGFGLVYKGKLRRRDDKIVAVKKMKRNGTQGTKEFLVEVHMLSILRHPNLVKLVGYCDSNEKQMLVYEYMPLESLEEHLHDRSKEPLDWNTRITIAIGAAKGLEYLHKHRPPFICRDFKPSNILLDHGFIPKLSDFGLARVGPAGDATHVTTRVMGTLGYCAPDYADSGKLRPDSDVYSFGVVLLELLSGQYVLDRLRPPAEQSLVDWSRLLLRKGDTREMWKRFPDPRLKKRFPKGYFHDALLVACQCTEAAAEDRPNIKEVLKSLSKIASNPYDPKSREGRSRIRDNAGSRRINRPVEHLEGAESTRKPEVERSEEGDTLKKTETMQNQNMDRGRAVAEAKK